MASYYDLVLGLIPLALFVVAGLATVAGLGLTTAVPLGAGVSIAVMGHAMFVNGPVDDTADEPAADAGDGATVQHAD
jgi:hypothetical protein